LVHHHFAAWDKLKAQHAIDLADIVEVVLGCEPLTLVHNGAAGPRPTNLVAAQFSAEYGMAMRMVRGRNDVGTYLDLQEIGFADPAITSLADRVRLEGDAECAAGLPMGRVTLKMRDGSVLSETGYALGSPLNPLSRADIEDKYRALVSRDFGDAVAERSLDLIMNVEQVDDLGTLTRMFEPS
jgi:2-methylcitrate dehydratase PrpD